MVGVPPAHQTLSDMIAESMPTGDDAQAVAHHSKQALEVLGGAVPMRLWLPLGIDHLLNPQTAIKDRTVALAALTDLTSGAGVPLSCNQPCRLPHKPAAIKMPSRLASEGCSTLAELPVSTGQCRMGDHRFTPA